MLPNYESNQMTPYLKEFNLVSGSTRGSAAAAPFWYGYPVLANNTSSYAALSNGSTNPEPVSDTTSGDRAFNAGFIGQE